MLPSFLIVGGQRCGTTSLYRYLLAHPQVRPALVKEVQYFTLEHGRGFDWYRSNFPPVEEGCLTFDASPYYLFHPLAARRAAAELSEAKLIALLRNPVDRAFSHYRHNVGLGNERLNFEDALEAEEGRLAGEEERILTVPGYRSLAHRRYSYCARGFYRLQLERWLEVFDRSRLLVIVSEELFADPAGTYRQVLNFLDLPPHDLPDYPRHSRGTPGGPPMPEPARQALNRLFATSNRELQELLQREFDWG